MPAIVIAAVSNDLQPAIDAHGRWIARVVFDDVVQLAARSNLDISPTALGSVLRLRQIIWPTRRRGSMLS
jgi:hypothetical protein